MIINPNRKFGHVVITGASSGIGEALAHVYAAPGMVLSLTGRNPQRLEAVAKRCREKGGQVHISVLDVADASGMADWLLALDTAKPIDLLIANAGISGGTGGVMEGEDAAQVRRLFEINVNGVFNTIDPVLPRMIERGSGHIALMSSLAAFRGWPGAPAYCASKAAVKVYGEGLRGALAKTGVNVSVICPGFVKSRMTDVNEFPMPMMVPAERAARIIAAGIARNRGRIAFPLPVHFFAWLFGALPDFAAQKILGRAPAKKAVR